MPRVDSCAEISSAITTTCKPTCGIAREQEVVAPACVAGGRPVLPAERHGLRYGQVSHTWNLMKTTIDLDEAKLERVMKLTGLATRREAIDFALTQAERAAKVKSLLSRPFFEGITDKVVVDPAYDVLALRRKEKPARA